KGCDNDRRSEEDRLAHLLRRQQCSPPQIVTARFRVVAADVFYHHYRSVYDDAEIDRAHRDQVRRFAADYHENESEQQRERNRERYYKRCAQVPQKGQQYKSYQHHSLYESMIDCSS